MIKYKSDDLLWIITFIGTIIWAFIFSFEGAFLLMSIIALGTMLVVGKLNYDKFKLKLQRTQKNTK